MEFEQWKSFNKGKWQTEINVRDFIQKTILHTMEMKIS